MSEFFLNMQFSASSSLSSLTQIADVLRAQNVSLFALFPSLVPLTRVPIDVALVHRLTLVPGLEETSQGSHVKQSPTPSCPKLSEDPPYCPRSLVGRSLLKQEAKVRLEHRQQL